MLLADACGSAISYTDVTTGKTVAAVKAPFAVTEMSLDDTTGIILAGCANSRIIRAFAPSVHQPIFAIDCGATVGRIVCWEGKNMVA